MDSIEQAKQVEKLYTEVVETTLKLGDQTIKVWLRVMKYPVESTRAIMAFRETSDLMQKSGSEPEDCQIAGYVAMRLQTLFYALRKTNEDNSPRLFDNIRQASSIPLSEQERLLQLYQESFVMTEDEVGNSLRVKTNS